MDTSNHPAGTVGISVITALATTTVVLAATEKFAHPSILSRASSGLAKWTALGAGITFIYVYRKKLINWFKPIFSAMLFPYVTHEEVERISNIQLPQMRYPWDAYYDFSIKVGRWASADHQKSNLVCIGLATIAIIASLRMLYTLNHGWTTLFWALLAFACAYAVAFIIDSRGAE